MKCPSCTRPYYFATDHLSPASICRHCGHEGATPIPTYEEYHDIKYRKSHLRTLKNDPIIRDIHHQLAFAKGDIVLDYGCGRGDILQTVKPKVSRVIGLDRHLSLAQEFFPEIELVQNDQVTTPFRSALFDKIICVNVVEHIHNFKDLLGELRRILKDQGLLYITTYDTEFPLHDYLYDNTHMYEWDKRGFEQLLSSYFEVTASYRACSMFNFYPANLLLRHIIKPELVCICRKATRSSV